ncbi:MAG: mitochondrial fission ELM1 family protein [Candidatus Omnitrophica bacterium]|jgi:lauroyl/myristoyl acyltransferase|nr:mitochondrial fission ELM1 family protein [Candidatus Omnitrophota bacterium]
MKKNSIIDYSAYIILRFFGPVLRAIPVPLALFLGRILGGIVYTFDHRHRCLVFANIKTAMGENMAPCQVKKITARFYAHLGQTVIELFLIPKVDRKYIDKYISFEGWENVDTAAKSDRPVIFLAVHAGNWELSNIICANLGINFSVFVRDQSLPHLDNLLNQHRQSKSCRIIHRENQLRQFIQILKDKESVGMTVDQGGKNGVLIDFLGKPSSMGIGAVKFARKYGALIVPVYFTRIKGPYQKVIVRPPIEPKHSQDEDRDMRDNLEHIVRILEKIVYQYPYDYLWLNKIWKYSNKKNILVLSDAKAGHLNQSRAAAELVQEVFLKKGITASVKIIPVEFKSKFKELLFKIGLLFSGPFSCQGCLWCLRAFLKDENYLDLWKEKPDVVISAGSSLAGINFLVARQNLSKSVAIMRPGFLSLSRFNLVIAPRHDRLAERKNVAITEGALNLVNAKYLKEQAEKFRKEFKLEGSNDNFLGVLIGGDSKGFFLDADKVSFVLEKVKEQAKVLGARILLTTSRRTSSKIEEAIREKLKDSPDAILIIANQNNFSFALGGILGLSSVVICSAESISMVSEAASSGKKVIVFQSPGLSDKHNRFLANLKKKGFISYVEPDKVKEEIENLFVKKDNPVLDDKKKITEILERTL